MSDSRPRQVTHRGKVFASGFIIPFDLVRPADARRRILKAWQPNSKVYRLESGLVFVLPKAMPVTVEEAVGSPLVCNQGVLASCPLPADGIADLSGSLAWVSGGKLVCLPIAALPAEITEDWISVDTLQFQQGVSLGDAQVKPSMIAEPHDRDIRETLKDIPVAAAEVSDFLSRLKGKAPGVENGRAGISMKQVLGFLRSLFRPRAGSRRTTTTSSRFAKWWDGVVNRLTRMTRLSKVIGLRQARYLVEVIEMFESGDMKKALRHAIPLSSISESPVLKTSFGLPTPRQNLTINPWAHSAVLGIGLAESVYTQLEKLYRETFRRLEAQGRIDEAAFVLAELLRANEEAVAFLERHGRFRQAAEIAEARGLPAEFVVRLWYIAGEKQRAIQIARKTGAFIGTIISLEKSRHPLAATLRKDWALTLADAGDPAAAVEVLWPLSSERAGSMEWMKKAVELGGVAGARNLARLLVVSFADFEAYRDRALALLQSDSVEDADSRLEFAESLLAQPNSAQTKGIARAAVRAMLRDIGRGVQSLDRKALRQLIAYTNDGALQADAPRWWITRRTRALRDLTTPLQHTIKPQGGGAIRAYEVAPLAAGGYALALGEAGLRLVTKDGRTITHVDQPTFHLVVSHSGARVIAVAPRGKLAMLSKLDVPSRRATPWCLSELNTFTTSFNGDTWYVTSGQDLYAIDATSPKFDALWRIPDIGVPAGPLTLTASTLCFVTRQDKHFCLWEYRHPNLRLTNKSVFESFPSEAIAPQFSAFGNGGVLFSPEPYDTVFVQLPGQPWETLVKLSRDQRILSSPVVTEDWIGLTVKAQDHALVLMFSLETRSYPMLRLRVQLEEETEPVVRIDNSLLTIASNGSAQTYDLTYGNRIVNLRY